MTCRTPMVLVFCVIMLMKHVSVTGRQWFLVPKLHSNVRLGSEKTFVWSFNEEIYDEAEVTVIHAPLDLHSEFIVASEYVTLGSDLMVLDLYQGYRGRVNVTYQAGTITLQFFNCTFKDDGEIFVQVISSKQPPLEYAVYLNVYEEPKWKEAPPTSIDGVLGADLSFSLSPKRSQWTLPIQNVFVQYGNQNMTIISATVGGHLTITCKPLIFHRHLRYVGDADLHELQFRIHNMSWEKVGLYHVAVYYNVINISLHHTITVNISEPVTKKTPVSDSVEIFPDKTTLALITTYEKEEVESRPFNRLIVGLAVFAGVAVILIIVLTVVMIIKQRNVRKYHCMTKCDGGGSSTVSVGTGILDSTSNHTMPAGTAIY